MLAQLSAHIHTQTHCLCRDDFMAPVCRILKQDHGLLSAAEEQGRYQPHKYCIANGKFLLSQFSVLGYVAAHVAGLRCLVVSCQKRWTQPWPLIVRFGSLTGFEMILKCEHGCVSASLSGSHASTAAQLFLWIKWDGFQGFTGMFNKNLLFCF